MKAHDLAFVVGGREVSVDDFAKAISIQDGCGEEFDKDEKAKAIRLQETRDILDRAFRLAGTPLRK